MKIYNIDRSKCISCGTCDVECPRGAIIISDTGKFSINAEKCAHCGICEKVCPVDAIAASESAEQTARVSPEAGKKSNK